MEEKPEVIAATVVELRQPVIKAVKVKSFKSLAEEGETLPELKKLFGNNILEGNTVLFPAERGLGKTYLALQIAIAVAEGYVSLLGEEINLHGNTLYINLELGETIMQKRLSKLYKNVTLKEGNQNQAFCITERRSLPEIQDEIEVWIQENDPVLVVIDNLRMAFRDSDNERNKEMTRVIAHLNELRDKYSFALILVHHTRKGTYSQSTNSDLQSGAGAISDLVDGDFFLRRSQQDSNLRILKRAKSRNCEEQSGAKLIRLNPDTLWFNLMAEDVKEEEHVYDPYSAVSDREDMKKEAINLRAEGKSLEEIGEILGKNKSTVSRWLS